MWLTLKKRFLLRKMFKSVAVFSLAFVFVFSNFVSLLPQGLQNNKLAESLKIKEAMAVADTVIASGNWTAPTGVTSISVEVWGAGGGGGGQNLASDGGAGGGGGAYSKKNTYTVVPGNNYAVTIGTAGTAGNDGCGGTGGDTYFVSTATVMAKGGVGGCNSTGTPPAGGLGGAAGSGVGDVTYSGGQGEKGRDNAAGSGGYGGSSAGTAANGYSGPQTWSTVTYPTASTPAGGGHGGNGGGVNASGSAPIAGEYGGGGGGSGESTAAHTGGAGAGGKAIITYTRTTLSDFVSGEPSSSTIAPGASGLVDSFGLATDIGTDTVSGATVTLTSGMGQYIQTVAITNDGDTVTYCSAAPSGDTATLTSCGIPVTTTNTQFKIKLTAQAHAAMPAPDGGTYNVGATVTAFTNWSAQTGTDSGSATLTVDNDSPAGTTGAGATSGEIGQSVVSWTPPGDGDLENIYIYCKTSSLLSGEAPVEGDSPTAGSTCDGTARLRYVGGASPQTFTGLTNGTTYYFRIYARDTNGNFTAYSATQQVTGTPSAPSVVLTVGTSGSQTANADSGATAVALGGAFTFVTDTGSDSVTSIKVSNNGDAGNLSNVNLYYDTSGNGYGGGDDTLFGTGTLGAAIGGSMAISTTMKYVYVVADIPNTVAGGKTVDLQIANPSTDVATGATNTDTVAKNITASTTIRPNVTDVTNSPLGDGGRNGDTFTITGAGFGVACGSISVVVGGLTLTCNSAGDTTISATIPSAQTTTYGGASSMLVTVGGTADDANQTYYVYPNVTVPPTNDSGREASDVTVQGTRFGATQGTVDFVGGFGTVSASITSWSDTSITVTVPTAISDSTYLGDINVTRNSDSKIDLVYDTNGFRVLPRITLLTPNSGPNGQSTTIDGDHLCQPSGTCQSAATFNATADDGNDVEWGTTDATVTGAPSNTQIIANAPTLSDGGYQVTVTSGGGTSYTSNELTFTIANNASPTLSISAPPAGSTTIAEGSTYNVTYTLGDTDDIVTAAFYYDTNNDGVGGTAISGCGAKAEGTNQICSFDTSVLTNGTPYYVYGVTSDGVNPTVTTVSSGTITANDAPTLSVSTPPGGNTTVAEGSSYNVTYTLADTDNVVTAAFYYDTNNDGVGGVAIAGCGAKAEGTNQTCSFDTSVLTVSTPYYVYGVTSDGVNSTVTTVSSGTITVNDAPTITVTQPDGTGDTVNAGDPYNITYTLADTDNVVTAAMYYDADAVGLNGTAITGACATAGEGTGVTCSWDTTGMTPGSYYVYGITNDGINAEVSDYSPGQITINAPPQVVADSVGTQTANFDAGTTGQYVGAAFTFRQTTGSADTITALTISDVGGSVNANTNLSNAFLRYEQPGVPSCTYNGTETSTGTVSFNASDQAVFSGLTIPVTVHASNVTCVYLVFDLKNGTNYPIGGQTFEPEITSSANFTLQNSTAKGGTYPVALSGTTTIRPNVTDATDSSLGDGGRNGETFTITGAGFGTVCASISVQVEGTTLTCNSANNTTISATVPSAQTTTYGGTGASGLLVTVGGTADDTRQTYYVYPNVTVPPTNDSGREASDVTVQGTRFGATQGTVDFVGGFGTVSASITSWSDTSITVTVPTAISDSTYLGDINVTRNSDSKIDLVYDTNGFRVLPRITGLTSSPASVNDPIVVNGDHLCQSGSCPGSFSGANKVTFFSGVDATYWGAGGWTNTAIDTKVPAGATTGDVVVTSDTGYTSNSFTFTLSSATPNDPTDLGQFKNSGLTQAIAIGGTASSTPIYLSMTMQAALSGGTLYPQVEYKPIGTPFTCSGTGACASASEGTGVAGPGPTTGSVSITPTDDIYHWQARVCHNKNGTHTASCGGTGDYPSASWVSFGGNGEGATDFLIDTTPPAVSSVSSGTPGTNSATIAWSTASEISSSQVQWNTTGTFVANCATNNDCTAITDISPMVNSHSVTLSNLNSGTTYHYRVRSKDAAGNETIDPSTGDYTFATQAVASPAKTTRFHIVGKTSEVTNGSPLSQTFSVFMPELATSTKSAFIEIVGVYTTTSGTPTITVQMNGEASKVYALPPVSATSHFKILHQVSSVIVETADANTLTVTPNTNTSVFVNSADININYSYTP